MNPIKPVVELPLQGVTYRLSYDFDAIAEAEDIVDRPLITGLRRKDIERPTINLVRAMFFAAARANHPELTYEQIKALVTRDNWGSIWGSVLKAWIAGSPEPEESAAPSDPTQGQS